MKVLVLEDDSKISNIYQKIFNEKKIEADFVVNEPDFMDKADEQYDYLILEKPLSVQNGFLEKQEKDRNHDQNFLFLSSVIPKNNQSFNLRKETRDLLEKPFAMIALLAKLELNLQKKAITI